MTTNIALFEKNKQTSWFEELSNSQISHDSIFQTEILIGGTEIIEKISAEWLALCEEGASNEPFFRPEWFIAFVKNFEKEVILLTVRRNNKLRAVLPLVRKSSRLHGVPVKKLEAVFNLQTQRFDLIHGADETERQEIVESLWKVIKTIPKWYVLELRLVKKDSWLNDLLAFAESENYKTGVWEMDGAPFITLPRGENKEKLIEQYFKTRKKNFERELNRRLRRLKEIGQVEFVMTQVFTTELMQTYLNLEAQGWKGRSGTAAVCDARAEKLHHDFARAVASKNALFIYQLKLNGETIAMNINIKFDTQIIHWKTSYNEEYARFAPGNLLFRELLGDCIKNDLSELDFMSPAAEYKKVWATGESEHQAFYVFQRGVIGSMLWKWKFSVISYLRQFKKSAKKVTV